MTAMLLRSARRACSAYAVVCCVASCGGSMTEDPMGEAEAGPPLGALSFRLDRGPGNGFCIQPGQAFHALITAESTGELFLSGSMFLAWSGTRPDCVEGEYAPDCFITGRFEGYLTQSQGIELKRLLDELPEDRCEPDPARVCDPCLVTTLDVADIEWSAQYTDHCCGTQLSDGYDDVFAALVQLVDDLAAERR